MSSPDLSSSLLELENEIQATVQQLRDDIEENQELYEAIDDIDKPIYTENDINNNLGIDTSISPEKKIKTDTNINTSSTNNTKFFTPHSVLHQSQNNQNQNTNININTTDLIQLPQKSKLVNIHNTDTHSIKSNGSTISNRSDKRAMFKAFLRSKTDPNINTIIKEEDQEYIEIRSDPDPEIPDHDLPDIPISAESKPEEFQKLLDELNHEIQQNTKETSELDLQPSLSVSPLPKPAIFQQLIDGLKPDNTNDNDSIQLPLPTNNDVSNFKNSDSLHIDEDEIIDDGNSETQQELSDLLQEIEVSQKQFQDQLIHVDQEFLSMRKSKSAKKIRTKSNIKQQISNSINQENGNQQNINISNKVHFEENFPKSNRPKLRMSQSLNNSPKRSRVKSFISPIIKCYSFESPVRRNTENGTETRIQSTKSTQFEFGTGRELLWEKKLRQKLENEDPLAVNLDKITSPRRFKRLKLMVDRARNPSECTFQPKTNRGLPSMYPAKL